MNGITAYRDQKGLCEQERSFLAALKGNVKDEVAWLAYSDWLAEQGREFESLEARAKTDAYRVSYYALHVPTGQRITRNYGKISFLLEVLENDDRLSVWLPKEQRRQEA